MSKSATHIPFCNMTALLGTPIMYHNPQNKTFVKPANRTHPFSLQICNGNGCCFMIQ